MIFEFISDLELGLQVGIILGALLAFFVMLFVFYMASVIEKEEKKRDARHKQLLHAILNKK